MVWTVECSEALLCVLFTDDNDTALPIFHLSNVPHHTLPSQQSLPLRLLEVPGADDPSFEHRRPLPTMENNLIFTPFDFPLL